MHRLVAAMLALSLALVVPVSAFGGKPTYEVTGITVTSTGAHGVDWAGEAVCGWSATVTYSLGGKRAAEVDFLSQDQAKVDMSRYGCPVQPDGDTTFTGVEQVTYGDTWQWSAWLVGRSLFRSVSPVALTGTYTFTRYSCPAAGTVLATYP